MSSDGDLKTLLDIYLEAAVFEMGLSEKTVAAYAADLREYVEHLAARGVVTAGDVDREVILSHLVALRDRAPGLCPRSIMRHLSAIRRFHAFLHLERFAESNPVAGFDSPHLLRALPKNLSEQDVERLLSAPRDDDPDAVRDAAILELFYSCGLRISELANLPLRDMTLAESLVRVRGKGLKVRLVPLGERAIARLQAWLRVRAAMENVCDDTLFLSKRGRRMGRTSIWAIVKRYAEKAGIQKRIYPHLFRHQLLTHLAKKGIVDAKIQLLSGHANRKSLEIYHDLSLADVAEEYQEAMKDFPVH